MKKKLPEDLYKEDLLKVFDKVNSALKIRGQKTNVTILGGAAAVLKGYIPRSTNDIDILGVEGAEYFIKECEKINIPVQIVTVLTTIDSTCEKEIVFSGDSLKIYSVTPKNLIKSKLERFESQDSEDIYKIIEKEALPYKNFETLVKEMLNYFVGNKTRLIMAARTVVENIYPDNTQEFYKSVPI